MKFIQNIFSNISIYGAIRSAAIIGIFLIFAYADRGYVSLLSAAVMMAVIIVVSKAQGYTAGLDKGAELMVEAQFTSNIEHQLEFFAKVTQQTEKATPETKEFKMDDILDKIHKSGMSSLSKEEKDFLNKKY